MNKFWVWMKKDHLIAFTLIDGLKIGINYIPDQVLIGYMIEYCNLNKINFHIEDNADIIEIFVILKKLIDEH